MEEVREVVVFFHSRDLDGWMSAAIVQKRYPDVRLVGWDYGDPEPFMYKLEEGFSPGNEFGIPSNIDLVIIVDIAFHPVTMMNLMDNAAIDIVWIDHHLSAIKQSREGGYKNMPGARNVDFATCELTWKYFFPHSGMPDAIELLGAYDCFRHKKHDMVYQEQVMCFQYAARTFISSPEDAYVQVLAKNLDIGEWMMTGAAIFEYLKKEAEGIFKKAFPVDLDEYTGLMVCRERFNPVNFGIDYHKDGYDFFGCFWFDGDKWTISLYNDNGKVDVSEICKKRGGGGHAGASGMTLKNINEIIGDPGS